MLAGRVLSSGVPGQLRNISDDPFKQELFGKFDEMMKVKAKVVTNRSMQCIQIGVLEKQTMFLTD